MPRRNNQIKHIRLIASDNCQSKKQYPNEKTATDAADLKMLMNMSLEIGVYQCSQCNKWHLTQLNKPTKNK